ncbi:hypothetical protein KO488_04135 [Poseidonibacter lekithochrous]|uniref:DUF6414 family protein n=1 Tax=Poseidonibacter TaxID=2321187 RepID=UPI001C083D5C|nr:MULTISPECIES: hypothetical protein [Poseidonibacter]MBU3013935.1 hypothetical protein [Poseidonibacter lekithochrous]MDO6827230.1 hypothetical protein [Poseidonibacter sp. 1_MG-2023]
MIKNFIYLDVQKLQSLSSQLFNGVTEYIITKSATDKSANSQNKTKSITKETIIADILNQNNSESEKKFLDDYLYLLFEEKLLENDKIVNFNDIDIEEISYEQKFIKVKSKIIINDNKTILNTFENFNTTTKSLHNITTSEAKNKLKDLIANSSNNNEKNILKRELSQLTNNKVNALDDEFIKDLTYLIKYGYKEQFEIQMNFKNKYISSNLKREYLREDEELLIRKYSRFTEIEFTLLGIVTQSNNKFNLDDHEENYESIKKAIYNMINHIANIESQFTGLLENEIVVDPIAVYYEL